jgi:hypothetical protein
MEASNCATSQELTSIIWNSKVHKDIGPYPEPDKSNPYHPILSLKIHFNIVHPLRLGLSSGPFSSGFPTNILYIYIPLLPMRTKCSSHLILLDLIILIIFGEEYKLWDLIRTGNFLTKFSTSKDKCGTIGQKLPQYKGLSPTSLAIKEEDK